ncbi:MAG: M1 family metallopeptidase [Chloroflexi bacterium]|nr:M1 family metallopeptidase [Chloroflexota bacterium]
MHSRPSVVLTILFALLGIAVLSACNLSEDDVTASDATATPDRLFTLASLPPPQTRQTSIRAQQPATAQPSSTPPVCAIADVPDGWPVHYDLNATLDWETRRVVVRQIITYHNTHAEALNQIVFHVEPRRLAGTMTLQRTLDHDGRELTGIQLDGWRLTVPLAEPVPAGCTARVQLLYTLQLQPLSSENPIGWLAYTPRQLNLGHWFPTVGLYGYQAPGEWYTPDLHFVGEQSTPVIADYAVRLEVQNGPEDLMLAGPGKISQPDDTVWEFELDSARDFTVSLSTQFELITETAGDVEVELYYFPSQSPKSRVNTANRALTDAKQALERYTELFGPYPYERLVIVEGDFPDGMEFSGLVFVSEAWFRVWDGSASDWLTIITVHEISHQWWYVLVANNQALNPYLDEALATYSELLYYEYYYPDLAEWWWDFRIFTYPSEAPVDSTVYDYSSWRPYINAVYLRGVTMLHRVRNEIGDEAFYEWLRAYAAGYAWEIATPNDFWGTLNADAYLRVSEVRHQYMLEGDILPPVAEPDATALEELEGTPLPANVVE